MQRELVEKYLKLFTELKESNVDIKKYLNKNKNLKAEFKRDVRFLEYLGREGNKEVKELLEIYYSLFKQDNGMRWWVDRDSNNKISLYHIYYPVKDSIPFETILTRQEAEIIFGLYTYYGGNITARNVANEFARYTLTEIKRIFRTFQLTKDSIFAPPHLVEELDKEQLAQYRIQLKEKAAFKYCDAKQERDFNNQIKKMASEINRLNDKNEIVKSLINPIDYEKVTVQTKTNNDNFTGIICLADLHIGAFNVPEGYIDLPEYSEDEINRRLDKIIIGLKDKNWTEVIVLNLGDNVDSYRKMTSSMTHQLPCIYTDKEIAQMYLRVMMRFMNQVKQIFNNVKYISIGSGNHSSTWGWLLDITLSQQLKTLDIDSYISNNEIDSFDVNNVSFIFLHGKTPNDKGQFKGFPLNLNEKTQCWFNDFFADTNLQLQKKKVVLKGDLHQYSINSVSSFDYINCPSIYASSTYIVSNFGVTPWACAYIEVYHDGNYVTGLIREF